MTDKILSQYRTLKTEYWRSKKKKISVVNGKEFTTRIDIRGLWNTGQKESRVWKQKQMRNRIVEKKRLYAM